LGFGNELFYLQVNRKSYSPESGGANAIMSNYSIWKYSKQLRKFRQV